MYKFIKNKKEIEKIKISGKLASEVLEMIHPYIKSGISTGEINDICHEYILKKNALPSSLGYLGFPKSICTSINEVVCHGIPSKKIKIKDGDIINVDVAVFKNGFHSDTSMMFIIGQSTILAKRLCKIAQESLYLGISMVRPGRKLCEIGKCIQEFVESNGFSVVREYCGHGIGKNFHEDPQILHYYDKNYDIVLEEGMVFTIEPIVNSGNRRVKIMQDNWTVKTKDRGLSAQYEHTVLVTKNGCEIITMRVNEKISKIF